MARSLESYPLAYSQAVQRALAEGEFTIPTVHPMAMRQQLFGYLKALRAAGQTETADAVEIVTPKTRDCVVIRDRSQNAVTQEIAVALVASGSAPLTSDESASIFARLSEVSPKPAT